MHLQWHSSYVEADLGCLVVLLFPVQGICELLQRHMLFVIEKPLFLYCTQGALKGC